MGNAGIRRNTRSILIFSPEMFPWYIKQILGLIPNQHAPINELTPPLDPSFAIFLFSMFPTGSIVRHQ